MYSREINGQEYTFGVSGKLIRNVLVMYDRQTESLWSQLLGEAVQGELVGTKLTYVPSWMTTWAEWKTMHPETVALDKGSRIGKRDTYDSYYASSEAGVIGETLTDERLYTKEFVIGVEVGDTTIAYPFSILNDEPIINDAIADTNLLIYFSPAAAAGAVYNRQVNGQTLTFQATDDPLVLTDAETGSFWDAFNGLAADGPLAGTQLERLKSTTIFWFGWKDFHPDTVLYGFD
ncbi:MAG: DUF3179 domain-containing protein [Ardenticatenaceae bacterium]|nr:DUF3179 domain-containing protein [Ardenticatenaceae bacterium]